MFFRPINSVPENVPCIICCTCFIYEQTPIFMHYFMTYYFIALSIISETSSIGYVLWTNMEISMLYGMLYQWYYSILLLTLIYITFELSFQFVALHSLCDQWYFFNWSDVKLNLSFLIAPTHDPRWRRNRRLWFEYIFTRKYFNILRNLRQCQNDRRYMPISSRVLETIKHKKVNISCSLCTLRKMISPRASSTWMRYLSAGSYP